MIDLPQLAVFALALTVAAGSPGPSIAALVSRVIARGWRDALPFVLAMWIGEVVWLTCAILGLAAIADRFEIIFLLIKYAGVAYLIYLAWQMWTAPIHIKTSKGNDEFQNTQSGKMFLTGLSITLGNPKLMVFYVALLPTLLDLATVNFIGWSLLALTTVVILAAIDLAYMLLATKARMLIRSPAAMRVSNRVSALSLGAAAGFIASKS